MIDVLIPVLSRPQNVEPLVRTLMKVSRSVNRVLFLCSPSDQAEIMEVQRLAQNHDIVEWEPGHADYARKMNHGFELTYSDFCFLGADDLTFTKGWDEQALRVAIETGAGVVATNDCANPSVKKGEFGTHCLVRRSYIEEMGGSFDGPGVLLHEGYDHNWCDRELCTLAATRGLYAFAPLARVIHRHPHWGSATMDSTYRKGLRSFREDGRLYRQRSVMWM